MIVPLFKRLRLSPILGYLVAGMLIGPHGFDLVPKGHVIEILAEFGVLFLLFMIGLELPIDRLRAMRRYVFGLGSAQVLVTAFIIFVVSINLGLDISAAIVIGFGLALSSTATVLGELSERGELVQRFGRVSLAVLLMQDLAVAPLLAMIPLLGDDIPNSQALILKAVQGLAALGFVALLGRYVFRPLFAVVVSVKMPELFTATSLFLVIGTSFLTAAAGLSMALGAFLAGILMADSEYRHQVEADISPFRGLFLGLFFMTVGMIVDGGLIFDHGALIMSLLVALLVGKALIMAFCARLFGLRWSVASRAGITLAQGGEFAFVLIGLAVNEGVLQGEIEQIVFLVVVMGIVATPFLISLGEKVSLWFKEKEEPEAPMLEDETLDLRNHVVIAGFGRVGQTVADLLAEMHIPYVALELDRALVAEGRRRNLPVYYGNAGNAHVLAAAGIGRAKAAVITLDQHKAAEVLVTVLHQRWPDLPIYARARDLANSERLERLGAAEAIPETIEASLRLGARVLRSIGIPREQVQQQLELMSANDYRLLREHVQAVEKDGQPEPPAAEKRNVASQEAD